MNRTTRRVVGPLVLVAVLPLAACSDDDEPTGTTTGVANPASVFCEERGGTLEIVDEAGGEVGYCNLPDGRRIEEWEYYRSEGGTAEQP